MLAAYAFVVGSGASVLRATGMAVVGLAARTLDQRAAAINILALTGAALLVADPLLAADTGFWLTTAATAGLVVGLGEADRDAAAGGGGWAAALVLTSVWAELALLPIVAAGLRAGDAGRRAAQRGGDSRDGGGADGRRRGRRRRSRRRVAASRRRASRCGLARGLVTESARVVEWLPLLSWRVPPPHLAVVVRVLLGARRLAVGARAGTGGKCRRGCGRWRCARRWCWRRGSRVAPASLVAWRRPHLDVTTLDVGQGDAIVVRFPNGATMLVDAGGRSSGSFDIGARVVGPALRARGIRRLDYLVVTHADADHIGGAASVVAEFTPAEVWTGVPVAGDAATAALRRAADGGGRRLAHACSAATGSRSARSRSACCTRRRPTGSVSASATTTRWCWR